MNLLTIISKGLQTFTQFFSAFNMDLIDPRIAEIMAKLNNKDITPKTESKKNQEKKEEAPVKPPTTYEDYLKSEKLVF